MVSLEDLLNSFTAKSVESLLWLRWQLKGWFLRTYPEVRLLQNDRV